MRVARLKGFSGRCNPRSLIVCSMSKLSANVDALARKEKRVAVIGAGAAGLVAARELRAEGHHVTVLEQSPFVGGVWRYDPRTEATDPLGANPERPASTRVPGSMYINLRTNLPREIMSYSDFPFDSAFLGPRYSTDPRRFCSHKEVLGYLEAFADFYHLRPLVRTGASVLEVRLAAEAPEQAQQADGAGQGRWLVTSSSAAWQRPGGDGGGGGDAAAAAAEASAGGNAELAGHGVANGNGVGPDSAVRRELYDAVVVCNGHHTEPRLPEVRGMFGPTQGSLSPFPGEQLHSHNYRAPDKWRGKVVLVVGASNSGEDVSRELSEAGAQRVLLAARSWKNAAWAGDAAPYGPGGNIYRYPMVSELHADGSATFEGGRREGPIDAVIYCTGYRYSFPFLRGAAAAVASVDDNCVGDPLWLHMLPPGPLAPGLSFIALPWKVVPLPQAELQSKLVARLLSGRVQLPSYKQMQADVAAHLEAMREKGYPKRYTHMQGGEQFAYNDMLASMCGPDVPPLPSWREQLYHATSALKRSRPEDYRDGDLAAAAGGGTEAAIAAARADIAAQVERLLGSRDGDIADGLARRSAVGVGYQ